MKKAFIFIVLLFLVTRIALIIFAPQELIDDSEFCRGAIAKEIIEGRSWPLYLYQNEMHSGGSLIIGAFLGIFFFLFGQNFLAIKLCALFISLFSFSIIFLILKRYFNQRAAVFSALFFIFSPTAFTAFSVILLGEHFESILFTVTAMALFFKLLSTSNCAQRLFLSACLGLICGFGVYFCYTFLITLAVCLISWPILDRIFFKKKKFLVFIIFAFLGFIPWFWYNLHLNFRGMGIYGVFLPKHFSITNIPARLYGLITDYLPGIFYFNALPNSRVLVWFPFYYVAIFIISYILMCLPKLCFVKEKIFFLLYPAVYLLIFCLSDFVPSSAHDTPPYKYLFPAFIFIFAIIGIAADSLLRYLRGKVLKFIVLTAFIVFPISLLFFQNIRILATEDFAKQLRLNRPYSYEFLGSIIAKIPIGSFSEKIEYIHRMKEAHRGNVYRGFAIDLWYNPGDVKKITSQNLESIETQFAPDFYKGFCMGMFTSDNSPTELNNIPAPYIKYCFEGAGLLAGAENRNLSHKIPPESLRYYYTGLGEGDFYRLRNKIESFPISISHVEEKYKEFYLTGLYSGVNLCETCDFKGADLTNLYKKLNRLRQKNQE